MSASRLLDEARTRGITLRARGGRLAMDGPPEALAALRPAIRAAKAELVALLHARAWSVPPGEQVPQPGSPYQCHACWRRFPEAQLTVVDEPLGCGFRCVDCLQRAVAVHRGERLVAVAPHRQPTTGCRASGGR